MGSITHGLRRSEGQQKKLSTFIQLLVLLCQKKSFEKFSWEISSVDFNNDGHLKNDMIPIYRLPV